MSGSPVEQAALGLRAHSGWAVLVAVRGPIDRPIVIHRRRIELADRGVSGSAQPYHAARSMELGEAEALLNRCADTAKAMAREAVQEVVEELIEQGFGVAGSSVLFSSGRSTTELAAILASHPLMHTSEGNFFREALRSGCKACGLAVSAVPERELLSRCAVAFGMSPDEVERQAAAIGKSVGPPWRQDEKLSAMAGWLELGHSVQYSGCAVR